MFPLSKGRITKQAHVGLPDGTYEEEHGREAFEGRASHLYRTHPPTAWVAIEGPLRPRAIDVAAIKPADMSDAGGTWARIAHNEDCSLYVSRRTEPMPYFLRDADGDLCYFVHRGRGTMETDYGPLTFSPGDYLIVPKGTTHRFVPDEELFLFVIEGAGEYHIPDRGMLGRHAQFDPGVIATPEPDPHDETGRFEVRVKRGNAYTALTYAYHPLDVVGWKGDLCPMRLNVKDFRPIVSPRYHLPPSVHCTWANQGFAVCTFAPRPTETGDPDALRVPFFHSNIDNDEVIFYHDGQFFSRAGITPGMMTIHPQGLHHGPQAPALEAAKTKEFADEIAVMVEAVKPLTVDEDALAAVIDGYETSWAKGYGFE
ncbi:MAG TPA: homogentisate 1,2-dioxygenase [Actinomycetota bacterium]|nr:homogentisate 1,2-dioxygenase [Actinomycetota bacterium]